MPRTKPTGRPTTGITKNPTTPRTAPSAIVEPGMPTSLSRRPGTAYFTTTPRPSTTAATANTVQAVAPPSWMVQTRIAPSTSNEPGSSGTTPPTTPTAMATATSTSTPLMGGLSHRAPTQTPRPRSADRGLEKRLCGGSGGGSDL